MFEKEAEEYAKEVYGNRTDLDYYGIPEAFQNGAEFGYNKANEWHYVKDGEYPKDNKPVLCILGEIDSDSYEIGYYNDVGNGESWHFENYRLPDYDSEDDWGVSAWKEIVLPELKESK